MLSNMLKSRGLVPFLFNIPFPYWLENPNAWNFLSWASHTKSERRWELEFQFKARLVITLWSELVSVFLSATISLKNFFKLIFKSEIHTEKCTNRKYTCENSHKMNISNSHIHLYREPLQASQKPSFSCPLPATTITRCNHYFDL